MTGNVKMSTNDVSRVVWAHSEPFFCFFSFFLADN